MSAYTLVRLFCFTCLTETAHRRSAGHDDPHGKLECEVCVGHVTKPTDWVTLACSR